MASEYLQTLPKLIAAVMLFMQAGAFVIAVLRLPVQSIVERASLSFGLGVGAITFVMLLMSLTSIPLRLEFVLAPWVIGWAAWLIRSRSRLRTWRPTWSMSRCTLLDVLLAAMLAVMALTLVLRGTFTPVTQWDGWAIWDLKARVFYLDGGVQRYLFERKLMYSVPDYPLLVPLSGTFVYMVLGRIVDGVQMVPALFFTAMLAVFYSHMRREGAVRLVALLLTLGLATLPNVLYISMQFMSEGAFMFYLLSATLFMRAYLRDHRNRAALLLTTLLAGAMTQTRAEAIVVVGLWAGVLLLRFLRADAPTKKQLRKDFVLFVLPVAAIALPWLLYVRVNSVPVLYWSQGALVLERIGKFVEVVTDYFDWAKSLSLGVFTFLYPVTAVLLLVRARRESWALSFGLLPVQAAALLSLVTLFFVANGNAGQNLNGIDRLSVPFTVVCYTILSICVVESFGRQPSEVESKFDRRRMVGRVFAIGLACAIGSGLIGDLVGVDLLSGSSERLTLVVGPFTMLRTAYREALELVPLSSALRAQRWSDDKRPFLGRMLKTAGDSAGPALAIAFQTANGARDVLPIWRARYELLPRRVVVVRGDDLLTAAALRERGVGVLIAYDYELANPPGEVVLRLSPRHAVIRVSAR